MCVYVCMYVCMYVSCLCHVCMHVCMHACMCIVWMHARMSMHIHICIQIHVPYIHRSPMNKLQSFHAVCVYVHASCLLHRSLCMCMHHACFIALSRQFDSRIVHRTAACLQHAHVDAAVSHPYHTWGSLQHAYTWLSHCTETATRANDISHKDTYIHSDIPSYTPPSSYCSVPLPHMTPSCSLPAYVPVLLPPPSADFPNVFCSDPVRTRVCKCVYMCVRVCAGLCIYACMYVLLCV